MQKTTSNHASKALQCARFAAGEVSSFPRMHATVRQALGPAHAGYQLPAPRAAGRSGRG